MSDHGSELREIIQRLVEQGMLPVRAATNTDAKYRFRYSGTGVPNYLPEDGDDEATPTATTPSASPASEAGTPSDDFVAILLMLRLIHLPEQMDAGNPQNFDSIDLVANSSWEANPDPLIELLVEQGILTTSPRWGAVANAVRDYHKFMNAGQTSLQEVTSEWPRVLERFRLKIEGRADLIRNTLLVANLVSQAAGGQVPTCAERFRRGLLAIAKWVPKGSRRNQVVARQLLEIMLCLPVAQSRELDYEVSRARFRQKVQALQGFKWQEKAKATATLIESQIARPFSYSFSLPQHFQSVMSAWFNILMDPTRTTKLSGDADALAACLLCEVEGSTVVRHLHPRPEDMTVLDWSQVFLTAIRCDGDAGNCPRWLGLLAAEWLGFEAFEILNLVRQLPPQDKANQQAKEREQQVIEHLAEDGDVHPSPILVDVILAAPDRLETGLASFQPVSKAGCLCVSRNEINAFLETLRLQMPFIEVSGLFVEEPAAGDEAELLRKPFVQIGLARKSVRVIAVYDVPPPSAPFDRLVPTPETLGVLLSLGGE